MGHVATEVPGQQFFGVDGFGGGLAPTRFPSGRQSLFVRAVSHLDGIVSGWCSAFAGAWSVRGSGQGRPFLGRSDGGLGTHFHPDSPGFWSYKGRCSAVPGARHIMNL